MNALSHPIVVDLITQVCYFHRAAIITWLTCVPVFNNFIEKSGRMDELSLSFYK